LLRVPGELREKSDDVAMERAAAISSTDRGARPAGV
jgi:hypothetical protein